MEEMTTMLAGIMPAVENWLRAAVREEVANALQADRQQAKPERMYSRDEVCAMLHVSKPTLWAWTRDRKIVSTNVGRRVLYSEAEVKRLMEG